MESFTLESRLTYSNPRKFVVIDNWPSGGQRVKATFSVEKKGTLERAVRTTGNNKPKKLTYARLVVFVDGSDGKLYILELAANYNFVTVFRGTFDYQQETIWPDKDDRYPALIEMLKETIS